jgi:outer membrane immunogenic protein
MLKRTVAVAVSILAGQASAQESYLFGGLGLVQGDYEYTYEPRGEGTSFESEGVTAFLGYGRTIKNFGKVGISGEADIAFGDMKSDTINGLTVPCTTFESGCTGEVNALATLRLVAGANSGTLRPFATLGLAVGGVEGTADVGACGNPDDCDYNETMFGLAAGLGATYEVSESWQLRGEIMRVNLGQPDFSDPGDVTSDDILLSKFRLGAQFRF